MDSMSFDDAQQACQKQNKRLCTEAEWTLACEGPDWKGYPYGSEYRSKVCASKDSTARTTLADSGSHPQCRTPDGVFDMTGNVWEWVTLDNAESKYQRLKILQERGIVSKLTLDSAYGSMRSQQSTVSVLKNKII